MLKAKHVLILILIISSMTAFSQKPSWTNYDTRVKNYPADEFLIGFASGINTNDEDAISLKSIYETQAKNNLVQGIQVEIESRNSLNVSNTNGNTDEEFLSKSVSFSRANVNGLISKSYYDRKKKEVFAFCYVNKKELAYYYRNLIKSAKGDIKQKLNEGRKYKQIEDKENALRSYYEAMPSIDKIDEARALLLALNRNMYAEIDIEEVHKLKTELINEINDIINPNELNLSESAYFIAYGLFLQLRESNDQIYINNISYENTDLLSDFSETFHKEFESSLIKSGSYKIVKAKSSNTGIEIIGNYWKEGQMIKISVSALKNDIAIAVSKGSLPISFLQEENIQYMPLQIEKLSRLNSLDISSKYIPEFIKLGMPNTDALVVEIKSSEDYPNSLKNIPLTISLSKGNQLLSKSQSNEMGEVLFFLPPIKSDKAVLNMIISIDLGAYLNIDSKSTFLAIAQSKEIIKPLFINIKTTKPTAYIKSEESISGKKLDINIIEPALKEELAERSFNFVDNAEDADFIIDIKANSTESNYYEGIYFAYLDVNISIKEKVSSKEIYKTSTQQIKGGGSSKSKAARKAYGLACEQIKDKISKSDFVGM